KASSKDSSNKVISEANATALGAAAAAASQLKTSHSAKPSFAFKPPVIRSTLDLFSIPEDGGNNSSGSKVQSIPKKVTSKSSSSVAKDVSASTVNVHDASAAEKAKIQDKASKGADSDLTKSGSKAKIQDKTRVEGPDASLIAPVQGEGVVETSAQGFLSSLSMAELRQIADNLGPLTDRFQVQLPSEPGVGLREPLSPSAGGALFLHSVFEAMLGEFLPFDMTFDSVEAAGGSLALCDEVPSNTFVMSAKAAAPFVAAAERVRFPQVENELELQGGDALYKSLLSSQMKSLAITQASLRQFNELTLARADRDRLRKDLSDPETKIKEKEDALALSEKRVIDLSAEKETLVKSTDDFKTKDALISVGTTPDQIPEGASTEQHQSWLSINIPYVVQACRAFSANAVHLAIRDLLHSLNVEGINALDSSNFSLSAFATLKASSNLVSGKCVALDSSFDVP
ncbi:hypothetical protein EJB05_46816, partial [Eragrostis curvula]